jgi:hypothetical protein
MTVFTPFRDSWIAVEAPIPVLAPVTIATRFLNLLADMVVKSNVWNGFWAYRFSVRIVDICTARTREIEQEIETKEKIEAGIHQERNDRRVRSDWSGMC